MKIFNEDVNQFDLDNIIKKRGRTKKGVRNESNPF